MAETKSRALHIEKMAFDKEPPELLDRTRAFREQDAEICERAEKTHRLRTVRLEREQSGKAVASLQAKQRTNP